MNIQPTVNILLAGCTLSLAGTVQAQDSVVQLDETTIKLDSISRDAEIDLFTGPDFLDNQIHDMEDLVRLMPGISVSKGDDRWGSSGFNVRGLDEDRVAINVDGVTQGETLKYEGGQAYGYFKGSRSGIDIEALKGVEVVKGADSILSGSGALAGAVNYTTKDAYDFLGAGDDTYFGLKSSYAGVNDEVMGSLTFANRVGNLEALIVYTRRDAHEYGNYDGNWADIEGSGREIPDFQEIETDSLLVKLNYLTSDNQSVGLVYSDYQKDTITDNRSFNGGWYSNRKGVDSRDSNRVGLTYDLVSENGVFDEMSARLNKQKIDFVANTEQHVKYFFGPTFQADEDRVDSRSFNQETNQFKVDFLKDLVGDVMSHSFVYGLEFQDKEFENKQMRRSDSLLNDLGWVDRNIGALIPVSEAQVSTLYAMDTIQFGENSKMRFGSRFDDYRYDAESNEDFSDSTGTLGETKFSAVNWAVGYEQNLSEALTASIGVSTGFRVPTIEEMYSTNGSVDDWNVIANPNLESESSTNFDVAIAGDYLGGSFRVGYFNSQYKDFIDYESRSGININTGLEDPNGYQVPVNSGRVDISGIEVSGRLNFSQGIGTGKGRYGTSFRAAYTDGEHSSGDPLYTVQPYSISLGLDYSSSEGNWGTNLYTTYTSGKKNSDSYTTQSDGSVVNPLFLSNAATVVDLSFFYKVNDKLRVVTGIYNLMDKEYYHWDNVRFIDQGDLRPGIGVTGDGIRRYSEPGRNARLSLSYTF
ncbi:MAG: TonB-dependent hemoglobin/transferrin/lactoferrin family receptor [Opitutales bacterium]